MNEASPCTGRSDPTCAVSVAVCTRNRSAQLQPTLDALQAMSSAIAHEILLVDNGSTDDTAAPLARFAAICGRVRVLHAPTPGLTRARNCAVQAARGDIIAFIDDDCYVPPGFVDDVWSAFADRPDCDFVGGRVLL